MPELGATDKPFAFNTAYVLKNVASGKAMQASSGSATAASITGGENQWWTFRHMDNGNQVRSLGASGTCLFVPEGDLTVAGTRVQVKPCADAPAQRIHVYGSGNIYYLRMVSGGLCLGTVPGGNAIDLEECTWNGNDQGWYLAREADGQK